jgi:hypothetical protein
VEKMQPWSREVPVRPPAKTVHNIFGSALCIPSQ